MNGEKKDETPIETTTAPKRHPLPNVADLEEIERSVSQSEKPFEVVAQVKRMMEATMNASNAKVMAYLKYGMIPFFSRVLQNPDKKARTLLSGLLEVIDNIEQYIGIQPEPEEVGEE